jgi:hypothetical protein
MAQEQTKSFGLTGTRNGVMSPLVYTTKLLSCVMGYPMELWDDTVFVARGERVTLDGCFPLRALLTVNAPIEERVWNRAAGTNPRSACLEGDCRITGLRIYAVGTVPVVHVDRTAIKDLAPMLQRITYQRPWTVIVQTEKTA